MMVGRIEFQKITDKIFWGLQQEEEIYSLLWKLIVSSMVRYIEILQIL